MRTDHGHAPSNAGRLAVPLPRRAPYWNTGRIPDRHLSPDRFASWARPMGGRALSLAHAAALLRQALKQYITGIKHTPGIFSIRKPRAQQPGERFIPDCLCNRVFCLAGLKLAQRKKRRYRRQPAQYLCLIEPSAPGQSPTKKEGIRVLLLGILLLVKEARSVLNYQGGRVESFFSLFRICTPDRGRFLPKRRCS